MNQLILPALNKKTITIMSIARKDGWALHQKEQELISRIDSVANFNFTMLQWSLDQDYILTQQIFHPLASKDTYFWIIDIPFSFDLGIIKSWNAINNQEHLYISSVVSIKRIKQILQPFM